MNFFASNEGTVLASGAKDHPDPADRAEYFPRWGAAGYEWSNRASHGMQTKLVDPVTRQLVQEPNQIGELAVKGPTIFPGYFKRPDLTEKAFDVDGYFLTGDLFEIASHGGELNRYRFVGRLKDLIIRGGFKIAPEELEQLLAEHPQVSEVAVVGIQDTRSQEERICAVVVPKENQTLKLSNLQEFLKEKDIAAYKLPKKLVVVDRLPRNPLGKVLKRDICRQIEEQGRG
jgi:acyl-CoA synthetase (AMP-forming)/AMP-acid ligase II